ncbi:MAG: hypothetical protein ACREMM_12105 [Gemmatimonadales bacterium]
MHYEDPPSPSAVIRGILGVAAVAVAVSLAIDVAWKLLALFLALWGAWSFFGQLFDTLVSPLGRFFGSALTGGAMPPGTGITIEQETATLERLLATDPPTHRAILAGIRLAEIYRTHQKDAAKADALIATLASRYPDARELKYVRSG